MDDRSDARLLRDAARDADAFGIFYDRHARAVANYFARRTGDRSLTADLTAETFAQAFANRRRYRDDGGPTTAWLFTIARRQLNEFYRRERVSAKYRNRLGVVVATDDDAFDRVDDLDELRRLQPHLAESIHLLSDGAAKALELRIVQGLPYRECAERLGCTPGAARVRVSRALASLHDHITNSQTTETTNTATDSLQGRTS